MWPRGPQIWSHSTLSSTQRFVDLDTGGVGGPVLFVSKYSEFRQYPRFGGGTQLLCWIRRFWVYGVINIPSTRLRLYPAAYPGCVVSPNKIRLLSMTTRFSSPGLVHPLAGWH